MLCKILEKKVCIFCNNMIASEILLTYSYDILVYNIGTEGRLTA